MKPNLGQGKYGTTEGDYRTAAASLGPLRTEYSGGIGVIEQEWESRQSGKDADRGRAAGMAMA